MKKWMIVFMVLFVFYVPAYAQMGMMGAQQGQMGQGMMMGEGQQMPMMNCPMMQQMPGQGMAQGGQQMPMMQQMPGQGMMMQNMMQMMMDMMNMQEKMMMGAKPAEKKKMMKEMAQMKENMQKMMSMRTGMMGGMMGQPSDIPQCKLTCAEQWLKKAIDLHEVHIKDAKTATEASQMEMMDQMKKAYECITGACCGMNETPSKEPVSKEKAPKGDVHGH
jgi:hypothetical protein